MIPFAADTIEQYTKLGAWGTSTLSDLFQRNAAEKSQSTALVDPPNKEDFSIGPPRCLTYEELRQEVDQLAAFLISEGFKKDDILLVQFPNIVELIVLYLAAARIGLIVSPIPVQYRRKEIEHILSMVEPKAFFTTTRFKKFNHAHYFSENFAASPVALYAWGDDPPGDARSVNNISTQTSYQETLDPYLASLDVTADDIYTICWTSGTEGNPKGVPRTHNNWLTTGAGIIDGVGLQNGDSLLVPFPMVNMASIGALVVPWLMLCSKLVLHHPFDLTIYLDQIQSEKVNYSIAAPAILNMLLQDESLLKQTDISSLKYLGTGSAPPDAWMMKKFQKDYNLAIANYFGSNEGTPLCAGQADIPDPEKRSKYFPRAGTENYTWRNRAANWIQTKLIDPANGEVIDKPGVPGELAVRGPSLFPGYYMRGDFDRSSFDADGFFRSGDLFEIATDGDDPCFYRVVGRKKELIIRGGMNISPVELDDLLSGHPKVREVAVAGYPDEILGERVCAFVVPADDEEITLDEIIAYLTEIGIAPFKLPEKLMILKELPRSPVNKVLRRKLKVYSEHQTLDSTTIRKDRQTT